jgi:hypothetical protein
MENIEINKIEDQLLSAPPLSQTTQRQGRHDKVLMEVLTLYLGGASVSEICDKSRITRSTFQHLKKQHKWAEMKIKIDRMAEQSLLTEVVSAKQEAIKRIVKIISLTGAALLERIESGEYQVKMSDYLKAVQAMTMMTTPSDEAARLKSIKELNSAFDADSLDRELLDEVFDEMTEEEKDAIAKTNNLINIVQARKEKELSLLF